MVTPDALNDLRQLISGSDGDPIPDAELHAIGHRLVQLFELLSEPIDAPDPK